MPQKINLTLLSIFLITLLVPLVLVAVLVHVFLHPSLQAELIVGGGTIFFASIAVIGALLKISGKRQIKPSWRQLVTGFIIGPLGLGLSALAGSFSHHALAGIVVGVSILVVATVYLLIGPRTKSGEQE